MNQRDDQPQRHGDDAGSSERDLIVRAMREAASGSKGRAAAAQREPDGRHAAAAVLTRGAAAPPSSEISGRSNGPLPPADSFPGYELVREIHRGAQGVVYQAIQKATRRKIAVKVLLDGAFASPGDRTRFEREVTLLSQLDHPNIVAIHDSGVTDGRPWFVMDYVSGPPLDTWLSQTRRSVTEILRMMVRICDAVHAAHLRGVIHRDLKPGNIRIDASSEPRILDFGLAKSVGDFGSADGRMVTVTGQFIGSLPWASPEQAEGNPARIDLRSDVYSLGVILYQLLTGTFPYEVVGHLRDVLDNILHTEPARPSTVGRGVNDEVETIVLKSLSKEPQRRYQSAHELARDLERYLNGEPIEAKRDSGLYVLRKTLRRYRGAAAVVVLFVALLATSTILLWQAERRSDARAVAALAARDEMARALAARDAAVDFLLADMIAAVDPRDGDGRSVRVVETLDAASGAVPQRFAEDRETEIDVRRMIGAAYQALGLYGPAEDQRATVVAMRRGGEPTDLAEALIDLATTLVSRNRGNEALGAVVEAEALLTRLADSPSELAAVALMTRASALAALGLHGEAAELDERALETFRAVLPDDHLRIARAMHQLGIRMRNLRRLEEAESLLREAMDRFTQISGPTALETMIAAGNLANCLMHLDRADEAVPLLELSIAERRERLGPDDPRLAAALQRLAEAHHYPRRDSASALSPVAEALEIRRRRLDPDHLHLANTLHLLGLVLIELDRADEAEPHLVEALRIRLGRLPAADRQVAEARSALGHALARQDGRLDEALPLLRDGAEALRAALGPDDNATRRAARRLADALERAGLNAEAAAWRGVADR